MVDIPILMNKLLKNHFNEEIQASRDCNPFRNSPLRYEFFGPSARFMFKYIFIHYALERDDEIAIITTSDATYVATCVSIPCFNYAKISRVVTERTRVIILIHEYGYVIDNLTKIIEGWRNDGIVVVEDCAHVCGLEINGRTIGSFGDFALFSLTKTIPGKHGGLLRTNVELGKMEFSLDESDETKAGIKYAEDYLCKQNWFNTKRNLIADIFRRECRNLFEPTSQCCPYFLGVRVKNKKDILTAMSNIEFGATLDNELLYIPTNPLVDVDDYKNIVQSFRG